MKDVLLVGYGAVGAMYAFILKKSGQVRVTVVARGNYEAAKAEGLHIKSRKYGEFKGWRPDRLFPSIRSALDRPYSYLLLATKAIPEITRTPELLAPLLSPPYSDQHTQPTYVLMQNGLNVEVDLYNALKKLHPKEEPRIISTAVWIAANMLAKNVVEHADFDRLSLGMYRPASDTTVSSEDRHEDVLTDFAAILASGGSDTTVVSDIQRLKFAKNFWNAVFGGSTALMRLPLSDVFRPPTLTGSSDPTPPNDANDTASRSSSYEKTSELPSASPPISFNTIPVFYDALSEIRSLGAALFPSSESEMDFEQDLAFLTLQRTAGLNSTPQSTHRASMLVDVENGRPMEIEVVLGELVRMGRAKGVAMPRTETLYALLLVVQNELLRKYRLHEQSKRAAL